MTRSQATEKLGTGPGNKAGERGLSPPPRVNFFYLFIYFLNKFPELSHFNSEKQRYISGNFFATEEYLSSTKWQSHHSLCRWVLAQSIQKFVHCTTIILFLRYSYSQI